MVAPSCDDMRHLDHRGQSDPAIHAMLPELSLFRSEAAVIHDFEQPVERNVVGEAFEFHARGGRVRIGIVGDQVSAAEFGGIDAEPIGGEIDDALRQCHRNGMADGPVLASHVLVREHGVHAGAILLVLVRPAGQVHDLVAFDAARARIDGVRTDRSEIVQVEGEDFAVLGAGEPQCRLVLARMDVGHERFQPVGDEFHRAPQHDRQRRGRHLVGIDVDLDAVGSAHVPRDYPHVAFGDLEVPREDVLHHVRRLRRVIHGERALRRVVVREDGAGLQRHSGVASELVSLFDHEGGALEGSVDFSGVEFALEADVVAEIGVNYPATGEGVLHFHDGRQLLPSGLDVLRGVFRLRAGFGDDRRHRLALPAGALDGERVLGRRLDAFQVAEHRDPGLAVSGKRASIHDRDDAGHGAGLFEIKVLDASVGVGAAEKSDVRKAGESQIVDERPASVQQALRVRARNAFSDIPAIAACSGHVRINQPQRSQRTQRVKAE
jgi:hypothetical protein